MRGFSWKLNGQQVLFGRNRSATLDKKVAVKFFCVWLIKSLLMFQSSLNNTPNICIFNRQLLHTSLAFKRYGRARNRGSIGVVTSIVPSENQNSKVVSSKHMTSWIKTEFFNGTCDDCGQMLLSKRMVCFEQLGVCSTEPEVCFALFILWLKKSTRWCQTTF